MVRFYPVDSYSRYKYVVIFARHKGKWVYARHKERETYEAAGGHVEAGETAPQAANRELFEETGAAKFKIYPVCDFAVRAGDESQLFYAEIDEFSALPPFEMAEIKLFESIPSVMTYPQILPALFGAVNEWFARQV